MILYYKVHLNVKDDDEIGGLFLLQLEKVGMMMNTLLYCYTEDYTTLVSRPASSSRDLD